MDCTELGSDAATAMMCHVHYRYLLIHFPRIADVAITRALAGSRPIVWPIRLSLAT